MPEKTVTAVSTVRVQSVRVRVRFRLAFCRARGMCRRRGKRTQIFHNVARQLRISAKIIFFQRKVGVGLGKGARACGKSCHFECMEKKQVAKK